MEVARQFIAWKVPREDPPRRVRCDGYRRSILLQRAGSFSGSDKTSLRNGKSGCNHRSHRTLRDGITAAAFQAINCLATFIWSLRDNMPVPYHPYAERRSATRFSNKPG